MELKENLEKIAACLDADIFLFSGNISLSNADVFMHKINALESRKRNIVLILTTYGGDPDAGYRIARFIKNKYEKFILYVFGFCKSAGTLIALGADEIVMTEFGELGPLDMQVTKEDEMVSASSLAYLQTMATLKEQAFNMFEGFFLALKGNSGNIITTKTAASIATSLTTGILAPIAEQIDPLRLCEVQRMLNIAIQYGNELAKDENLVAHLTADYPSHGCVIDYQEAKAMFRCVREPSNDEQQLADTLHAFVRLPNTPEILQVIFPTNKQERNDDCESKCDGQSDEEAVDRGETTNQTSEQVVSNNHPEVGTVATEEDRYVIEGA